jgi:CrcB protein
MKTLLLIFLGGGLGSVSRYALSKLLNPAFPFPIGTFAVNILGSLLIGFILGYAFKNSEMSNPFILFLTVGFCGGFTTFSAFALENLTFLKNGEYTSFAVYSISSLLLSIVAVFLGFWLIKTINLT